DKGRAKIELAVARGKKLHDKRETERKRSWERERGRLMRMKGLADAEGETRPLRDPRVRLGAVERVLSRRAGCRGGQAGRARRLPLRRHPAQFAWPWHLRRAGGAPSGAARQ